MRAARPLALALLVFAAFAAAACDGYRPGDLVWSGDGDGDIEAFNFPGGRARLCISLDLAEDETGQIIVSLVEEASGAERFRGDHTQHSGGEFCTPGVELAEDRYVGTVEANGPWELRIRVR